MKKHRLFITILFIILTLTFIGSILAFGYEEGTMRNETIGVISVFIMQIMSFPSIMIWDAITKSSDLGNGFYLGIIINALFYSFITYLTIEKLNRPNK